MFQVLFKLFTKYNLILFQSNPIKHLILSAAGKQVGDSEYAFLY